MAGQCPACSWAAGPDDGRADRELDTRKARLLGLPAGQHPLGIVRLDPALEKTCRDRQFDRIPVAAIELHACEPARIDILADFGAKPLLHARPTLLFHVRHRVCLWFEGGIGWAERGTRRDAFRRHEGRREATRNTKRRRTRAVSPQLTEAQRKRWRVPRAEIFSMRQRRRAHQCQRDAGFRFARAARRRGLTRRRPLLWS